MPVLARPTRALALLLRIVALLVATVVAKPAFALSVAGMCDDDARSAVAPIPVLPADGGEILPVDACDDRAIGVETPHPGSPEASPLPGNPAERSTLSGVAWPPAPLAEVRPVTAEILDPHRSGFRHGVFRPPRA